MSANRLEGIAWYRDPDAAARDEPGIIHSYVSSLATALNYIGGGLDPDWLMGASAFAFRINVAENLCPSAMSIFNWSTTLPEAVEQAGYHCTYLSRMWDEEDKEEERRAEAHTAIKAAIDRGAPAVVWDIYDDEWGLIVGYDEGKNSYTTLTHVGKASRLAFTRLGRNGIDILSVAIAGEPNQRSRERVVRGSLEAAVAHAEGQEWTERPGYQNGLAGYDQWATAFDRWSLLVDGGKAPNIPKHIPSFAAYYAAHYYSARCYARGYLQAIADGCDDLLRASQAYGRVAALLRPVWERFPKERRPSSDLLKSLAHNIRSAKAVEEDALGNIRQHLSR